MQWLVWTPVCPTAPPRLSWSTSTEMKWRISTQHNSLVRRQTITWRISLIRHVLCHSLLTHPVIHSTCSFLSSTNCEIYRLLVKWWARMLLSITIILHCLFSHVCVMLLGSSTIFKNRNMIIGLYVEHIKLIWFSCVPPQVMEVSAVCYFVKNNPFFFSWCK